MLEGFQEHRIDTGETELFLKTAGDGPPVLLLHGYPQTHVIWRTIAPALARDYAVVVPDMRGYGASGKPPSDPEHRTYSKRAMAQDMVAAMRALGHQRFAVVGHDRGARVTYRLALDHPERIERMASLDVVPTGDMWNTIDMSRAMAGFHWQFLAQPAPLPETMIGHDPDYFLEWLLRSWAAPGYEWDEEALAQYRAAFRDPETIRATCEDYRAGATCDHADDEADRAAGNRVRCPLLSLWGEVRPKRSGFTPLDVWKTWADDVRGGPLACGHFLPEEAPADVLAALRPFLAEGAG